MIKQVKPETLTHEGIDYREFLRYISVNLRPNSYFEIGTRDGDSVSCFNCDAICVDPEFQLAGNSIIEKRSRLHLFQTTSDKFFAEKWLEKLFPSGPDIAFLDGLHLFEYLVRDFYNTERSSHSRSIILIHDCLPLNSRMTSRFMSIGREGEEDQTTRLFWTGDVWKIVPILKKYRPEIRMFFVDCPPTGLVCCTNLNPISHTLVDKYHEIVESFRELSLNSPDQFLQLWASAPMLDSRILVEAPHELTTFLNVW